MNDHPLPALRNRLLSLHKILMLAERAIFEKEGNVIESPNHFLQLLMSDARFAWLRDLSQLIVMMDEAMEEKPPITTGRADTLVDEARLLLASEEKAGSFAARYAAMVRGEPAVAAADADIRKIIAAARE